MNEPGPWIRYRVLIGFRHLLLGGIPASPETIARWITSSPNLRELMQAERQRLIAEHQEAVANSVPPDSMEELKKQLLTVFPSDEQGSYIEARQIVACLREAATTSGMFIRLRGFGRQVGLKQTFQHGLVVHAVPPNPKAALYLPTPPDRFIESVAHVTGPQGPRSCFKIAQAAERPELTFEVWLLNNGAMDDALFGELMEIVGEVGIGKDRSQGHGKFDVLEWCRV